MKIAICVIPLMSFHQRVYEIGESVWGSGEPVLLAGVSTYVLCCLHRLGIVLLVSVRPSPFLDYDLQCCALSLPRSGWVKGGLGCPDPPERDVVCFVSFHPSLQ